MNFFTRYSYRSTYDNLISILFRNSERAYTSIVSIHYINTILYDIYIYNQIFYVPLSSYTKERKRKFFILQMFISLDDLINDFLIGSKTEGFFIESGACDGEIFSSSLLFELERNYTG